MLTSNGTSPHPTSPLNLPQSGFSLFMISGNARSAEEKDLIKA